MCALWNGSKRLGSTSGKSVLRLELTAPSQTAKISMQTARIARLDRSVWMIAPGGVWKHLAALFLPALWLGCATAQSQSPGAIDPDFNAGAMDGAVRAIALAPDSKIVVIGDFTQIGSVARRYVARLNSDGSLDNSFVPAPELWLDPSNRVTHVAVQSNGAVLLGGRLALPDLSGAAYLVRLTSAGSLDASFQPVTIDPLRPVSTPSFQDTLKGLALQPDDKVVVGYSGCSESNAPVCLIKSVVRRITAEGLPDPSFAEYSPSMPIPWQEEIQQICLEPSGSLVTLWLEDGYPWFYSASRLTPAGVGSWGMAFYGIETGMGPVAPLVDAIAATEDGSIWVSGLFGLYPGAQGFAGLSRVNPEGNWDLTCVGHSWPLKGLLALPGRRILVNQNGALTRLDSRARVDPSWQPTPLPDTPVAMAQQADGKVLVGGAFSVGGR